MYCQLSCLKLWIVAYTAVWWRQVGCLKLNNVLGNSSTGLFRFSIYHQKCCLKADMIKIMCMVITCHEDIWPFFLVFWLQSLTEAEEAVKYLESAYRDLHLTLQPLVLSLPGSSMVVYNSTRFVVESLIKAVDLCFKLTHVWDDMLLKFSTCWLLNLVVSVRVFYQNWVKIVIHYILVHFKDPETVWSLSHDYADIWSTLWFLLEGHIRQRMFSLDVTEWVCLIRML